MSDTVVNSSGVKAFLLLTIDLMIKVPTVTSGSIYLILFVLSSMILGNNLVQHLILSALLVDAHRNFPTPT